ncbi:hypothetical protein WJX73_004798 [Symbiochloris irregularis]|uniref:C2H2-type domain-containing protein n=1 Tax=Symbiochloris irregularis TaxID=706552 RepID=A0AAW1PI71_9CHLO
MPRQKPATSLEKSQERNPNRFYCPYPGCKRSFAELWRLKVHHRAPPHIRGSGRERGHNVELKACPRCHEDIVVGKVHVCGTVPPAEEDCDSPELSPLEVPPNFMPAEPAQAQAAALLGGPLLGSNSLAEDFGCLEAMDDEWTKLIEPDLFEGLPPALASPINDAGMWQPALDPTSSFKVCLQPSTTPLKPPLVSRRLPA